MKVLFIHWNGKAFTATAFTLLRVTDTFSVSSDVETFTFQCLDEERLVNKEHRRILNRGGGGGGDLQFIQCSPAVASISPTNTPNKHPIVHPRGRGVGCLLWVLCISQVPLRNRCAVCKNCAMNDRSVKKPSRTMYYLHSCNDAALTWKRFPHYCNFVRRVHLT